MKIRMVVTVEVKAEDWVYEYGCEREDVREDVRRYVANLIDTSPASHEVDLNATVR